MSRASAAFVLALVGATLGRAADPLLVKELTAKQTAAKEAHGKLEATVKQAVSLKNGAAEIKHAISVKQATLRGSRGSQHILQDKVNQVDQVRDHLLGMLHKDMDPKIELARTDLKKKDDDVSQEIEKINSWTSQENKLKANADRMVQDLKATRHQLEGLRAKRVVAKKEVEVDAKHFDYNKQMASQELQSLTYAAKQHQSESARLAVAEERFKQIAGKGEGNLRELARVEDARRDLQEEKDRAKDREHDENRIRAEVAKKSAANMTSYDALTKAEAKEHQMGQQQAELEKQYKTKQDTTNKEVESLKTVEGQNKAEHSHLKVAETAAKRAKDKMEHLEAVRSMEAKKIELFHAREHARLEKKISEKKTSDEATSHDIADLSNKYSKWEQDQQKVIQELATTKQSSAAASQAYDEDLHHVLKKIHQK